MRIEITAHAAYTETAPFRCGPGVMGMTELWQKGKTIADYLQSFKEWVTETTHDPYAIILYMEARALDDNGDFLRDKDERVIYHQVYAFGDN